jgi:ribose transport system permease protein
MTFHERFKAWRYNHVPYHIIGEVLTKRWTDSAIPFVTLIVTAAALSTLKPGFFSLYSLQKPKNVFNIYNRECTWARWA